MDDNKNTKSFYIWLGPFMRVNENYASPEKDTPLNNLLTLIGVLLPFVWNIVALFGSIYVLGFFFRLITQSN